MSIWVFLLLCLAAGIGGACRYIVDQTVSAHNRLPVPMGTFVINCSACLLLGFLTGLTGALGAPKAVSLILGTGLLGGYSTFSTAAVEGVRLVQGAHPLRALLHTGGMFVLSLLCGALGLFLGFIF